MADAARDQRETTLALQGEVEEPGADAGGPLVLMTAQQNAVTRNAGGSDPFEHEPPEEFSREDVPRVYAGESDFYDLVDSYDRLAGRHLYALEYAKLARRSRDAVWREKEKALDDLKDARKEIARLNEVLQNDLRSRVAAAELALKNRPRVVGDVAADEAKLVMQACECPVKEAEDRYIRLQCDFLVTQRQIEMLGTLERTAQEQNHLTRSGLGGGDAGRPVPKLSQNECAKQALRDFEEVAGEEDEIRHDRSVREGALTECEIKKQGLLERLAQSQNAGTRSAFGGVDTGGPGPGHYIAIAELKVVLGKLEVKLEAAQTENARLHQLNLELVTARHDALLSEVARPKKRARVEDGNVAADEAKPAIQALEPAWKLVELAADEAEVRNFRSGLDFLDTQRAIKRLGHLYRDAQRENHLTRIQKQNQLTRSGLGGDAGRPGPGHYVEIAVLKGTVGKLEIKLAAAQKEITRLNEALQDELRAQRDSAVAELAQKKRRRVDDAAAANQ